MARVRCRFTTRLLRGRGRRRSENPRKPDCPISGARAGGLWCPGNSPTKSSNTGFLSLPSTGKLGYVPPQVPTRPIRRREWQQLEVAG